MPEATPRGDSADSTSASPLGAARGARVMSLRAEESLRTRLCARDERALVELIEVASPWLLSVLQGMLQDADEAEEVALETFRIAWDKVQPVTEDSRGLLSWVLQIARNRAIDRLRSRRRRQLLTLETAGPDAELAVDAEEPNEAATPGWHVHTQVHSAMGALPDVQHTVVQLAYFEGLTHSEIAQRLELPLGTVKTRLRLAFDKLRVSLAPMRDWIT